jgi:hypothetical protein
MNVMTCHAHLLDTHHRVFDTLFIVYLFTFQILTLSYRLL